MSQIVQTSYLSNPITVLNASEVNQIEGEFVYNFYLKDETSMYHTSPTSPLKDNQQSGLVSASTIAQIEEIERGSIRNRVPRYIKIKITPSITTRTISSNETYRFSRGPTQGAFKNGVNGHLGPYLISERSAISPSQPIINREGSINSANGVSIVMSDSNVKTRTFELSNRISAALLSQGSLAGNTSEIDIVEKINEITSDEISEEEIKSIVCQSIEEYDKFVNDATESLPSDLDRKSSTRSNVKLSLRAYKTKVSSVTQLGNPFNQNVLLDRQSALGPPTQAGNYNPILRMSNPPADLDFNECEPEFTPYQHSSRVDDFSKRTDQNMSAHTTPKPFLIGFLIERKDGTTGEVREYVALEPNQEVFYDTEVLYGRTYTYACKQLYFVHGHTIIESSNPNESEEVSYSYFVSSAASNVITVAAKEKTPPRPVSVLFCSFIYKEGNGVRLRWQMPDNAKRDIKKFQVFRRKSIKEPFKLIAEYDFNDPGYPSKSYEYISPSLCYKSDRPVLEHIDPEFQRDSSMIYSICAVDARGQTSTMGIQIRASFDKYSNKLDVIKISKAGAPKQYPNIFLNKNAETGIKTSLLEDVARDSGHGKMRLYFNPDSYDYIVNGDTKNIVASTKGNLRGEYKFQIINLDRQKTKVLSVRVNPKDTIQEII